MKTPDIKSIGRSPLRRGLLLLILALAGLALLPTARAQDNAAPDNANVMARLIVTAIAEDTIAAPGNALDSYIVVSVTDVNGVAVTGLTIANFGLGSPIVGPGGSISHINSVSTAGSVTGVYLLRIGPLPGQNWKSGVYIWSVGVTRGSDHGQALCTTLMD